MVRVRLPRLAVNNGQIIALAVILSWKRWRFVEFGRDIPINSMSILYSLVQNSVAMLLIYNYVCIILYLLFT